MIIDAPSMILALTLSDAPAADRQPSPFLAVAAIATAVGPEHNRIPHISSTNHLLA
ncbi:MAG: hypothetical protein EBE86_003080 [Hormoscilla sp. GUM202]|nr:hypothetical protein [Hormoscilla sp. GUM202]